MQDTKAFGGTPAFFFAVAVSFLLGYPLLALKLAVAYVLSFAIAALLRLLFFRRRPDKTKYHNALEKIDASSFPSLHATRAFLFVMILWPFFHNIIIGLLLVCFALTTCVIRVVSKRHYVSDVVAGAILGIVLGILINMFI